MQEQKDAIVAEFKTVFVYVICFYSLLIFTCRNDPLEKTQKLEAKQEMPKLESSRKEEVDLTYSEEEQELEAMEAQLKLKREKRKLDAERFAPVLAVMQDCNITPQEVIDYFQSRFKPKRIKNF